MPGKTAKRKNKRNSSQKSALNTRTRLAVLGLLWLGGFLIVAIKLVIVQVVFHPDYDKIARKYLEERHELESQRGTIKDRNGEVMAVDLVQYSFAVRPHLLPDQRTAAKNLAEIIDTPANKILKRMRANPRFVYLDRRLNYEEVEKIRALKLPGVAFEKKFSRYYPYKSIGAHLVGFCDYENQARCGLELSYNRYLGGNPGWTIYLRDALGNRVPNLDYPTVPPVNGASLITTIDMVYQSILEEELRRAIDTHRAEDGSAVLMDPRTGAVLAMASYPGFDPNRYNRASSAGDYRNRAVSDLYEPGSTFKMVALAVCLEQFNLDLDRERVFCENGRFMLANNPVKDHKKFGWLTVREVFEHSSNIGIIKLAQKFDAPVYYRYARDFGFGVATGVDLPAEAQGILHKPTEYSATSLAYMSIGYEVAVTPLQVAAAYAAIANDGLLMQPYLVGEVVSESGEVLEAHQPMKIRQVVAPQTARRMRDILKGVVDNGTGSNASVDGLSIAGKTGTAQKFDVKTGKYSSKKHVASFAGFFPAEAPEFVLVVVINTPRLGYYGSQVAAPVFRNIARRIYGLPIRRQQTETRLASLQLPPLTRKSLALEGMPVSKAKKILEDRKCEYQIIGEGTMVIRQEPPPHAFITPDTRVKLFTEARTVSKTERMPNLTGLTLKEALQVMSQWDVTLEVDGSGVVVEQTPHPGERMDKQKKIKLICSRT